ncbi:MAG: DUF192 domain-containing protein [Saccharofermentanales bacterium]
MGYRCSMDGNEIAGTIRVADSFFTRLKGLLFTDEIGDDEGLLIIPCNQVHTIGMKFDIDVVFLSQSGEVLFIEPVMVPGKMSPIVKGSKKVLELKAGTAKLKDVRMGGTIEFEAI